MQSPLTSKPLGLYFSSRSPRLLSQTLSNDPPQANLISRTTLDSATFDNRGSTSVLNWEFTDSQERTNSTSFTSSTPQTFTANVSVETSIPEIGKVGESYQWQTGKTQTMGTVETRTATLSWSLSGSLDPGLEYRCYSYCQQGQGGH